LDMRTELDDKVFEKHYKSEKEFFVDGELVAVFYKLQSSVWPKEKTPKVDR